MKCLHFTIKTSSKWTRVALIVVQWRDCPAEEFHELTLMTQSGLGGLERRGWIWSSCLVSKSPYCLPKKWPRQKNLLINRQLGKKITLHLIIFVKLEKYIFRRHLASNRVFIRSFNQTSIKHIFHTKLHLYAKHLFLTKKACLPAS